MKEIIQKDGKIYEGKVITGDDISMSSPFLGKSLTDVLVEQEEKVEMLTRNVKYLTKYGGVGGGGGGGAGGGSGSIKTKFSSTITYTNINGTVLTDNIRSKSFYAIQKGKEVTITVILTSTATLNMYNLSVTYGSNSITKSFSGASKTATVSFVPESNLICTIQISGETTATIDFSLYLNTNNFSSAVYDGEIIYNNDQEIYRSVLDKSVYRIRLDNFLPDTILDDQLLGFTVGNLNYDIVDGVLTLAGKTYEVTTTTDQETNTRTHILEITNCQDIFTDYGIYKLTAYYRFNNNTLSQEINYIYKSEDAFVYAYSTTASPTLYQASQKTSGTLASGTLSSYNYTENFYYRLYGRSGLTSDRTYPLYYTIFKEGDQKTVDSLSTYTDESSGTEITETVGTKYYTTYHLGTDGTLTASGQEAQGSSNTFYRVTITKSGSKYIKKIESYFQPTNSAALGTNYNISFSNSYLPGDFEYKTWPMGTAFQTGILYYTLASGNYVMAAEKTPREDVQYYYVVPKEVLITFYVTDPEDPSHNTETRYYAYIGRTRDLEYIFTNQDGVMFYGAVHANTTDINNTVMDFPWSDGKYKITGTSVTKYFKSANSLCRSTINIPNSSNITPPSVLELVSGSGNFPFGQLDGSGKVDAMFSFGLKYYNDNYENPILKISFSRTAYLEMYKTKIRYVNNTTSKIYDRFIFPSDDKYHLISFYFKNSYTYDGNSRASVSSAKPAVLVFIDGVIELAPIELDTNISITPGTSGTSLTWYNGQWDYNYMGIMTFNGEPPNIDNSTVDRMSGIGLIRKYYHDFDVIIPSNYYQTYREFCNIQNNTNLVYTDTFDSGIYDSLGDQSNWISYYHTPITHYNKFVKINNWSIANLTDLPIYVVELESLESDTDINGFVKSTLDSYKEEEADFTPKYVCNFQKLTKTGDTWTPVNLYNDVRFTITYQGSSTLLYGAKNFYIKSIPTTDNGYEYNYYWTPDKEKFKPELGFNLKADMVDSSHSNNVIIGNFVNDYFNDSDNPGFGNKSDGIRPCLTGEPIILIITDSTTGSSEKSYLYLGIYNLNLTRSSAINLGYQHLDTEHTNCTKLTSNFPEQADLYRVGGSVISFPNDYVVAEVQGNNKTLFDYSQYDRGLLRNMFGDFYVYSNGSQSDNYSPALQKAFRGLNKLVYNDILKENFFEQLTIPSDKFETITGNFYYYNSDDMVTALSGTQKTRCISESNTEKLGTYSEFKTNPDQRKISIVGNPLYQFHQVVDSNGNRIRYGNDYYYYVEELNPLMEWDHEHDDKFHYVNVLKYYMVCMAFAMVDSVQKNLTIKCRNFNEGAANTWYLGFYDMDTAFGVNNAGGQVDFKAFSDYITASGEIIQDYCPLDITSEENNEGSLFDTPSSYLFLFAKYGNILHTNTSNPIIGPEYDSSTTNPLRYWMNLRETGGLLETAAKFCETYVNGYFGNLNPLLWNLNYMYKYFSATNNSSASDTEISKFNGTLKYRREYWLDNRFKILDVLFGIKNDSLIGNSSYHLSGGTDHINASVNNPDVEIMQTMFPGFTKGYPVPTSFSFKVTGEPRTPIVLQSSSNTYRLFIINTTGETDTIGATITSSTDIGFFGTQKITSLNEFGQFLLGSDNGEIHNQKITKIYINKGTAVGNNKVDINLTNVKSVTDIEIDVSSSNSKRFDSISIKVPDIAENSFTLQRIIIKGVTANRVDIINGSNSGYSLNIGTLSITDSTIGSLYLNGVIITGSNTFSNNKIGTYGLSGAFKNLSISDGICTVFNLESTTPITFTGYLGAVQEVSLGKAITKVNFRNGTSSSSNYTCTSFTVNGSLACQEFTMVGTKVSSLELLLDDGITTLSSFCLYNNTSLRTLKISGKALTNIYYSSNAFNSTSLSTYQISNAANGNVYKDFYEVSGLNVYYNGTSLFAWNSMKKEFIMPTTASLNKVSFWLNTANGFSSFMYTDRRSSVSNNNLSIADVAYMLQHIKLPTSMMTKSINLSNMFHGILFADGVTLQKKSNSKDVTGVLNGEERYKLSNSYYTFIQGFRSFQNALSQKSSDITNITGMFELTNFAVMTKEFYQISDGSNGFKPDGKSWSDGGFDTLTGHFGSFLDTTPDGRSSDRRVYVEEGLLGRFKNINIGRDEDTDGGGYKIPHIVLFRRESEGNPDEAGNDIAVYTEPNFWTAFYGESGTPSDCITTTLTRIAFYSDKNLIFDCSDGLPGTIKTVADFGSRSSACFMTGIEHIFDNVGKSCQVTIDRFMRSTTETWTPDLTCLRREDNTGKIALRDFFLDDSGNFKFTPVRSSVVDLTPSVTGLSKLPGKRAYRYDGNLGFSYPKYLESGADFKELLKAFKYGDASGTIMSALSSDLAYVFSNCELVAEDVDPTWRSLVEDNVVTPMLPGSYYTYFDSIIGMVPDTVSRPTGLRYIKAQNTFVQVTVKSHVYVETDPETGDVVSRTTYYHWSPNSYSESEIPPMEYMLAEGETFWKKNYQTEARSLKSIDGTFRGFQAYSNSSKSPGTRIPIDPIVMFNDNQYDIIYTMARAFEGCYLVKPLESYHIAQGVISMYRMFYNCDFYSDLQKTKSWTGNITTNALDNYLCTDTNGEFPLIPDGFFNVCLSANIDMCFASDSFRINGAEGQLYSESGSNPWWTGNDKVSSFSNIIRNAKIHPILGTPEGGTEVDGVVTGQETYDYVFPTWYVNSICQCQTFIPIFTIPADSVNQEFLCIFESVPAGGSGYGGRLPDLPSNISNTHLRYALDMYELRSTSEASSRTWKFSVYLTRFGSITLNAGSTYQNLIPLALADVLSLNENVLFDNTTSKNVDFNLSGNHPVVYVSQAALVPNVYYGGTSFTFRNWRTDQIAPEHAKQYITK